MAPRLAPGSSLSGDSRSIHHRPIWDARTLDSSISTATDERKGIGGPTAEDSTQVAAFSWGADLGYGGSTNKDSSSKTEVPVALKDEPSTASDSTKKLGSALRPERVAANAIRQPVKNDVPSAPDFASRAGNSDAGSEDAPWPRGDGKSDVRTDAANPPRVVDDYGAKSSRKTSLNGAAVSYGSSVKKGNISRESTGVIEGGEREQAVLSRFLLGPETRSTSRAVSTGGHSNDTNSTEESGSAQTIPPAAGGPEPASTAIQVKFKSSLEITNALSAGKLGKVVPVSSSSNGGNAEDPDDGGAVLSSHRSLASSLVSKPGISRAGSVVSHQARRAPSKADDGALPDINQRGGSFSKPALTAANLDDPFNAGMTLAHVAMMETLQRELDNAKNEVAQTKERYEKRLKKIKAKSAQTKAEAALRLVELQNENQKLKGKNFIFKFIFF
jgi:hypothetical protein